MEPTNWAPAHSDALREYRAKGMSNAEIANAINAKFNSAYSRNAVLGRAKRMGLACVRKPGGQPRSQSTVKAPRPNKAGERQVAQSELPAPAPAPVPVRAKKVKLRCIQIVPRHLSLIDLERGDCRYPHGGDEEGEAITFCGHPQIPGSSYCAGHFHLTRGLGTASERAAVPVALRLVQAA